MSRSTFYQRRFRPEFRPAFAAWLKMKPLTNPQAPPTPFAMPEYRVKEAARSEQLIALAGLQTKESRKTLKNADDYLFRARPLRHGALLRLPARTATG